MHEIGKSLKQPIIFSAREGYEYADPNKPSTMCDVCAAGELEYIENNCQDPNCREYNP